MMVPFDTAHTNHFISDIFKLCVHLLPFPSSGVTRRGTSCVTVRVHEIRQKSHKIGTNRKPECNFVLHFISFLKLVDNRDFFIARLDATPSFNRTPS